MPVEQSSTFQPVKALLIAIVAIGLAVTAMIFAMQVGRIDGVEFKLGDDIYKAGQPERLASQINSGGPVLYPALVSDRDIYLQHVGPDPAEGWYAFDARPPGTERDCWVRWQPDDSNVLGGNFTSPCGGEEFDAIGTGLPQYAVSIDDNTLFIDLNGVGNEADEDADEDAEDGSSTDG